MKEATSYIKSPWRGVLSVLLALGMIFSATPSDAHAQTTGNTLALNQDAVEANEDGNSLNNDVITVSEGEEENANTEIIDSLEEDIITDDETATTTENAVESITEDIEDDLVKGDDNAAISQDTVTTSQQDSLPEKNQIKQEGLSSQANTVDSQSVTKTSNTPAVSYRTHVQTYGWQAWKKNGNTSGTTGKSKRLEAIQINLSNKPVTGGIQYRTHIQTYGWESGWKSNGTLSGTTGKSKRLEAIQIKLTGNMANKYNVWYRVHAQHFGWMGWAKNGASAGTAGYSYRLEAIQIKLVLKGRAAPGSTAGAFRKRSYPIKKADSYETQDFKVNVPTAWRGRWYVDVTTENHGTSYFFYAPSVPSTPGPGDTYARGRILVFDDPDYARGSSWNGYRGSGHLTFLGKSSRGKYVYRYFVNTFFGDSGRRATLNVK